MLHPVLKSTNCRQVSYTKLPLGMMAAGPTPEQQAERPPSTHKVPVRSCTPSSPKYNKRRPLIRSRGAPDPVRGVSTMSFGIQRVLTT